VLSVVSKFTYLAAPFIIRPNTKIGGLRLVFDVEADELLETATKMHCIVVADLDSDRVDEYGPEQIDAALEHLGRADYLVGHNIAGYDLPLLERLYGWRPKSGATVLDTLIAGRLILPHIDDLDDQAAAMGDPKLGKLRGRYSIEAWGVRLRIAKVGADIDDWSRWTPEMQRRCVGDVTICKALWKFLHPDGYSRQALELEHRVAAICNQITAGGVPFDTAAAERLQQQWTTRRGVLEAQLAQQFFGTNLNSRAQIGALLEARGWVPQKRTEKTKQPKIDDEVLENLPAIYPEFTGLAEHQTLGRRLGQLSSGKEAWLKHVGADGRIHGACVHIGTPHSRAAHFHPNLAQVPNPKRGKPLAVECRALFHHPGDWVFVTCDQAGLQDRCFSHYLAAFDGGDYGRSYVVGADPHWKTATALELVSPNTERDKAAKLHNALREGSKSFRYGFLFGMRPKRAGEIITTVIRAARQIDPAYRGPSPHGAQALQRFEAATPGLRQLRQSLEAQAAQRGWVSGLDARRVPTGAQYKALNRIVTSAEAIICKRWLINVYDELRARFHYGWDGDAVIVAWIHDEIAVCCRPEIAEPIGEAMVRHAKEPGAFYDLKVPLDAEFKIGRNWAGEPINGAEVADAVLPGCLGSGASEIAHPQPFLSVEPEPDHRTPVENSENSGNSDARRDVGNARWKIDSGVQNGDRSHHQVHRDNSAQFSVASGLSDAPQNGIDHAPNKQSYLAGATHKILCPFHDDHDPSLQLYADGHYHCYVCGAHGDIDELPEAPPTPALNTVQNNTDTLKRSAALWRTAVSIRGTLAERYLIETRKLDLAALLDIDAVLRFHPRCPFDGANHPCLIALFRDVASDEAAGIHRIALTASGEKIGRMTLGSWPQPRAIKLRSGADQLVIGEGIETVIAGAMRLANKSSALWAMGSAAAIGKLPLVSGFASITILADREANNIGLDNARACAERWRRANRKFVLAIPHQAEADFNDLIRRKAP
jgi:DNA polymerase I-like protein with 3'-5' exonuclease and polymerase domains